MPPKKSTGKSLKKKKPALSVEEQVLFKNFKRGDRAAQEQLVSRYAGWVYNIARKYHALFPHIEIGELVAEGNRGLIEALHRYDTSRSTLFSTYAWFWIVKNMQAYISASVRMIGIPGKLLTDLKKIVDSMNNEVMKGKTPSLEAIARKLNIDLGKAEELLADKKNLSNTVSLDRYINDEQQEQTLGDLLEDKNAGTPPEMLDRIYEHENITALLSQLTDVEREVIEMRFGLKGAPALTLKETGIKCKLSPSKVRDIETTALIKLKQFLSASGDDTR